MAKLQTFQLRPVKVLDAASVALPARGEDDFLWRPEDLARHLRLNAVGTIRTWLSYGLITEADGWIKVGKLDRFISRVVKSRIEAGLFGKGVDQDGKPAGRLSFIFS